jgi:hypothetical protein
MSAAGVTDSNYTIPTARMAPVCQVANDSTLLACEKPVYPLTASKTSINYRQNSKNWLSPARDYPSSDWLNSIGLHQKFPIGRPACPSASAAHHRVLPAILPAATVATHQILAGRSLRGRAR